MRCRALVTWVALTAAACGGERERATSGAVADLADLTVRVAPARTTYAAGEPITLTLGVRNPTDVAVTLRFATGQRYDFVIESAAGAELWRWSAERAFTQVLGEQIVPPGWELNYNETFAGRLAPGTYRVRGIVPSVGDTLEARAEVVVRQ
jgi:hypothetical protein